ncbi:hypothetical protein GBA63_03100 [Rubrobacter tropicus]|uniref:Uncharacterized protein n=1 Tax=Rubrobacter tropicus TaxID=2653851 RepID=A0A6G8Q5I0_9ACTN|nr:DUF3267 domain-containing protein [Rubrobacter tropicus]QIN81735.1 hypothetical protein GBA63_03100 [Rubrobacter tropicus]
MEVDEGFATEEYVPGRRFYAVFAVFLVASLLAGLYVASWSGWEGVAGQAVWSWLLAAVAAGLVLPDLAQYAVLRRFGARPRRVGWIERGNGPLFAWWRAPDHRFTRGQFAISYGAPVLLSCAVVLAYVVRFPTAAPVLACILPFYLGNFWCTLLVLRKPEGILVQPFERGVRFHGQSVRATCIRDEPGGS